MIRTQARTGHPSGPQRKRTAHRPRPCAFAQTRPKPPAVGCCGTQAPAVMAKGTGAQCPRRRCRVTPRRPTCVRARQFPRVTSKSSAFGLTLHATTTRTGVGRSRAPRTRVTNLRTRVTNLRTRVADLRTCVTSLRTRATGAQRALAQASALLSSSWPIATPGPAPGLAFEGARPDWTKAAQPTGWLPTAASSGLSRRSRATQRITTAEGGAPVRERAGNREGGGYGDAEAAGHLVQAAEADPAHEPDFELASWRANAERAGRRAARWRHDAARARRSAHGRDGHDRARPTERARS